MADHLPTPLLTIFMAIITTLFLTPISWAESRLSAEEQAWLDKHPNISIAPDPDFAPMEFFDEDGIYKGIAADYVKLIEEKLNIKFTITQLGSWEEVLQQAQTREVDMFAAATSTPQRERYMNFTNNYIELPGVILVTDSKQVPMNINDLYGKKIAVASGYVWHDMIALEHPEIQIQAVKNATEGLQLLSLGGVDAMIINPATASYYIQRGGMTNLRIAGESGYFIRLAFAVRNNWPELIPILNKAISMISEEERKTILNHWIQMQQTSIFRSKLFWLTTLIIITVSIIILILIWNHTLRNHVAQQTLRLRNELKQREKAEDNYRRIELRYYTLFNSASDAFFVMEGEKLIDCNVAATTMLRCEKEIFIKQPPYRFSPEKQANGEDSRKMAEYYISQTRKGIPQVFEWKHQRYDGEIFDAEVSLSSFDKDNNHFILAIVRDISNRKRTELLKDEFISTISHEIRTPLTSIKGSLGLINGGAVGQAPEKMQKLLHVAYGNTERLLTLVNDLLDIQRLVSEQVVFSYTNENLASFMQSSIDSLKPLTEQYQVTYQLIDVNPDILVEMDVARMKQVMDNLISNACKFSFANSSIEISATLNNAQVHFSVSNHGPGIPESFRPYVFDRFTQADGSTTKQVGGTGLGLSIAKEIIEKHHGHIGFTSEEGKKTTFHFEIPQYASFDS